jgi:hypothetical protein
MPYQLGVVGRHSTAHLAMALPVNKARATTAVVPARVLKTCMFNFVRGIELLVVLNIEC